MQAARDATTEWTCDEPEPYVLDCQADGVTLEVAVMWQGKITKVEITRSGPEPEGKNVEQVRAIQRGIEAALGF
jgi:hypothetical protein